jgi:hypothetical protein
MGSPPYKRNAELALWALYINHYTEAEGGLFLVVGLTRAREENHGFGGIFQTAVRCPTGSGKKNTFFKLSTKIKK